MPSKRITAKDEQTGRTVTFDWHLDTPPTEADMAEVFRSAGDAPREGSMTIGATPPTKNGVTANRDLEATLPHIAPAGPDERDRVAPNSPRDLLERGSAALFGRAAPTINRAAVAAAQMVPGTSLLAGAAKEGAPFGGAVGGTLGGIVGGIPGAGALAGAGGALAGGLEHWFRTGTAPTADDVTRDAIIQGGGELLAPGFSKGVEKVALPLYRSALRPGALAREFGKDVNIAARGLKEGLPVNARSVETAEGLTTASRKEAMRMVKAAEDAGAEPVTGSELMAAFRNAFTKARDQKTLGKPGALAELKERVGNMAREFRGTRGRAAIPEGPPTVVRVAPQPPYPMSGDQALALQEYQLGHQADLAPTRLFQPTEQEARAARQLGPSTAGVIPSRILNGPPVPPRPTEFITAGTPARPAVKGTPATLKLTRAQAIKEEAQSMAADTLKSQAMGGRINAVDNLADRDLALVAQRAVEQRVPGVDAQNLNTKELLGLLKAMEASEARHMGGSGTRDAAGDAIAGVAGFTLGGGIGGAGAGIGAARLLQSAGPEAMSRIAIGMDRAGKVGVKHGDKLTNAVRALAVKLADDRRAEAETRAAPAATPPADNPSMRRADGSRKGQGFLGTQPRSDGGVSSEISVGVNIDGKEMDIPTMVPTLSASERDWLLTHDISDPKAIPQAIVDKAVAHARKRLAAGQPVFAP